jgi:toxin HigB-1
LDAAEATEHLRLPAFKLHPLKGKRKGYWSIWVNGEWRVTFCFSGQDIERIDFLDHHQEQKP